MFKIAIEFSDNLLNSVWTETVKSRVEQGKSGGNSREERLNIFVENDKIGENKGIPGGKSPRILFINQKAKGHSIRK